MDKVFFQNCPNFIFIFFKDHIKQVKIISIITRFNNNTDFCCFYETWMRYRLTNSQFFSEKISSFLKGREISKEINQGLYKAGPEFSFEAPMTFKEGWNFAEFCPGKTEFFLLSLF